MAPCTAVQQKKMVLILLRWEENSYCPGNLHYWNGRFAAIWCWG